MRGQMLISSLKPHASGIALAFVGTVVPDGAEYRSVAFNPAGNTFQGQLIRGLAQAGFPDIEVFSVRPVPSYPKTARLFFPPGRDWLDDGIAVHLLPFLNLTPLNQVLLGLSVVFGLF